MRRLRTQLDHTKNQTIFILCTTNPMRPVISKGAEAYITAAAARITMDMRKPTAMGTIGVRIIMIRATMDRVTGRPTPRTVIKTILTTVDFPTGMGKAVNLIRKTHIEILFRSDRITGIQIIPIKADKTCKGE